MRAEMMQMLSPRHVYTTTSSRPNASIPHGVCKVKLSASSVLPAPVYTARNG